MFNIINISYITLLGDNMLKINMEYRKGILFVRLKGNLNANTVPKFKEYTIPIIKDYGIKYVVYNLNELVNLDNTGESALLEEKNLVKTNSGKVLIVNNKINSPIEIENISSELVALDLLKI